MASEMGIAEEIIDRRTAFTSFQGQEYPVTTCRIQLHAWASTGVLCGLADANLTQIHQGWTNNYLPHLPRCEGCLEAGSWSMPIDNYDRDPDVPPLQNEPIDVDVRSAHRTQQEQDGVSALRAVLTEHDLRPWMFTDLAIVDGDVLGAFSHPLTFSPTLLVGRPNLALTTFLHEQLHWLEEPGFDTATTEASQRWPNPPPPPAGCRDAESTWLHMSICALEYQSLSEILGADTAATELDQHKSYEWIYAQILQDPAWFSSFLLRHGLRVPDERPIARRYCGSDLFTNIAAKPS
jgi:hypothetical protein